MSGAPPESPVPAPADPAPDVEGESRPLGPGLVVGAVRGAVAGLVLALAIAGCVGAIVLPSSPLRFHRAENLLAPFPFFLGFGSGIGVGEVLSFRLRSRWRRALAAFLAPIVGALVGLGQSAALASVLGGRLAFELDQSVFLEMAPLATLVGAAAGLGGALAGPPVPEASVMGRCFAVVARAALVLGGLGTLLYLVMGRSLDAVAVVGGTVLYGVILTVVFAAAFGIARPVASRVRLWLEPFEHRDEA